MRDQVAVVSSAGHEVYGCSSHENEILDFAPPLRLGKVWGDHEH